MITLGDPVPDLAIEIRDSTGALADGGAVTLTITLPDATTTAPTVLHTGLGLYSAVYVSTQLGNHLVSWAITGANQGAFTDSFDVESPAQGIVSLGDVKDHLRITRNSDDDILQLLILASSDLCESGEGTGVTWRRTVVTNEKHNGGTNSITTNRRPISSLTAVTIDGVTQDITQYDVESWRISSPYTTFGDGYRRSTVLLSYVAGGVPIPAVVRHGNLEMIRHLYDMHRGGANLPRQSEPDYTQSLGYLIPNRVQSAWQSARRGF